ncbi:MAG: pitrilysin family protein [Gammaproteobacteria bacterium]
MKIILKGLLLLIFCPVYAAGVHEYELDNGLKLLIKEDHRAPVVVSQVWYKVGASYEHDGITGVSHVLEHMMFKGTEEYPDGEFSRIIAENGGRENAFTGDDYTAYFQTLEASRLPISFRLEADRMRNLTLSEEEFKKEVQVVMEERRMRTEDKPGSYTYEAAMATAFQTSPYRQPIIGWMADLEAMEIGDLERWYQRWYAPNNAAVVVVGDVDPDRVLSMAKEHFGDLRPETVEAPPHRPEVEQQGIKRVTVKRSAEVAELFMIWKTPVLKTALADGSGTEEWEPYALEVLAGILSGGGSARFARELIRGREVAASANARYGLYDRLDSAFLVNGTPAQGRSAAELEAAIREQIAALQESPVTREELDRVKAQVISSDVYEKDSVFYQAMVLGRLETVGLPWRLADEYVERIDAVTPEQIRQVAEKYFNDDGLTVAELVPLPRDNALPRPQSTQGGAGHVH